MRVLYSIDPNHMLYLDFQVLRLCLPLGMSKQEN